MERYEHCTVEWYWAPPVGMDPQAFRAHFKVFRPDGSEATYGGNSGEVTAALTRLGQEGFEVVSCIGVANWILWTLKRRVSAGSAFS